MQVIRGCVYRARIFRLSLSTLLVGVALLGGCAYADPVALYSPNTSIVPSPSIAFPTSSSGKPQTALPVPTEAPSGQISPSSFVSPVVTAESTSIPPVDSTTRYTLDAILDYYQHTLSVTQTIHYVNRAQDNLLDLILVIKPNRWPGGFSLQSIAWGNGEQLEDFELQDDQMYVPLSEPLAPGDALELKLSYWLNIPPLSVPAGLNRSVAYGYSERQTNIIDWYVYIPPYQPGKGWLVHPHWAFGEHQVFEASDFQVSLTLAEAVPNLVIAASAPARQNGDTYTYQLDSARTFSLSASDQYLVQAKRVGDVEIYSYYFVYHQSAGLEVLQNSADALELFSRLFMPYPYSSFSVVEADFLDGMEYSGLFFLSHGFYNLYDGSPRGYLTFIAAHETAHQWWYGLVGNDQALEPWLDEALCTYMEYIFYEHVYADDAAVPDQSLLDWWWSYRVDFYEPEGRVDIAIYNFNDFFTYRNSIYLRGARFLHDLRFAIGDETFFSFLRAYARRNANQIATSQDFFSLLQESTDEHLDGLIEQYFQSYLANPFP